MNPAMQALHAIEEQTHGVAMSGAGGVVLQALYLVAAVSFIVGLRQMSSPVTARRGIVWAGIGMVLAFLATLAWLAPARLALMSAALLLGGGAAWYAARRVPMTAMPQMIAIYNGMGGGAAACIAVLEMSGPGGAAALPFTVLCLALLGALIGMVSFSGSLLACAKLHGWLSRPWVFPGQQWLNFAVLGGAVLLGLWLLLAAGEAGGGWLLLYFCLLALAYGVLMTLPIGGADMPVVLSLFNALTGLAVGFEGFVLDNAAMIVAGTVVGAAGTLLTQLMAKAMNRSLVSVLFSAFGAETAAGAGAAGEMRETTAKDVAVLLAFADNAIIVPGYGMAVAQAQHRLRELADLLEKRGVRVRFAIHPVAGRMPGHMNVLLAEAGVSYDLLSDLDEINADFPNAEVALVIGANDVVNPAAREDRGSPIYGMPILDADRARNCIVIKRGRGRGFSGIENALFYADNTRMLYGDGQKAVAALVQEVKALE